MEKTETAEAIKPDNTSKTSDRVGKVFVACADGKVEKVFCDFDAKPRRSYRTGEFYRPLTRDDALPGPGEEDISFLDPETFDVLYYRRVSPIDGCHFPKSFDGPSGSETYSKPK